MKKSIIQDIKKGGDTRVDIKPKKLVAPIITPSRRMHGTPMVPTSPYHKYKSTFLIVVCLVLCVALYSMAEHFQNARITLYTKTQSFTFNHTPITLSKDPAAPLHFEIMIVSNTETKNIVLTDSADVSLKATGTVTFYNTYSSKPVSISAGTFLADGSGKTYKTDKAISIPGFTMVNKAINAGKVDVTITAFLPGSQYNGNPLGFIVTAYKGTSKASKIYAKAKTALTGGAQGLVYKLGSIEKGTLDGLALSTFKSDLIKKATAQVPDGYIMYPDAYTYDSNYDDTFSSPTPDATISVDTTLSAILIKKDDLTHALVKNQIPAITDTELSEVTIPDIEKLTFAFSNVPQAITKDLTTVSATITGQSNGLWNPDIEQLRSHLVGIARGSLDALFKQDPGITSVHVQLFPPWNINLPMASKDIHIIRPVFDGK